MSPGSSGGPVVDASGRVVGIVAMKVSGEGVEGIGLALPINYVYSASTAFAKPPSSAAAVSEPFRQMVARAHRAEDLIQQAHLDVSGDVAKWAPVDSASAALGLDPAAATILGKVAGGRPLYVGDSVLRWGRCDRTKVESGIEVRLEVPRIVHEAVLPPE